MEVIEEIKDFLLYGRGILVGVTRFGYVDLAAAVFTLEVLSIWNLQ